MLHRLGRRPHVALVLLALSTTVGVAEAKPRRKVLDGIAAIVDDTCITRSELARFLAPHEAKLARELADHPAERMRVAAQLREEALRGLIDRRLFEKEGARRLIVAEDAEVSSGIAMVAAQNGLTVSELMTAVKAQGMDAATYRAEVKAQILEGKLVHLELAAAKPDWKSMPEDQRTMQLAMVREGLATKLREQAFIEIRN